MPFTFSHPALILPLRGLPRKWVSATGLVAGSVAPDFEKFIKMTDGSAYSHSVPGAFFFDLPLALGLAFLFHGAVRNSLIEHLPPALGGRLNRYQAFGWPAHCRRHAPAVLLSVLLGIASHLVWDSFTHRDGAGVRALPFLLENVSLQPLGLFRLYHLLDMGSSLAGGAMVARAFRQLPPGKGIPANRRAAQPYWTIAGIITVLALVLRISTGHPLKHVWDAAVVFLSAGMLGVTLAALLGKVPVRLSCPGSGAEKL